MFRKILGLRRKNQSDERGKELNVKNNRFSRRPQIENIEPEGDLTNMFKSKAGANKDVTRDMDRTLYEVPMPNQVDGITDLLNMHKDGDKFPYVGIVGTEGESLDARRSRLLSMKPDYKKKDIPEIEVQSCPLIDMEGEFTMEDLMKEAKRSTKPVQPGKLMPKSASTKDYTITKKYVHIKSVTGLYIPNMSSTSDYCKLWFSLEDLRMVNKTKCGQSNSFSSNQETTFEMSCDYCVSTKEMNSFSIKYNLERNIVSPGFQWGTVNLYFNITESDIPFQSSKKDTLAVYRMPITTLLERETNADKSDIHFTSSDIKRMRELFSSGDIVDVDAPAVDRMKKSSYSKSTLRGATKGELLESTIADRDGWSHIKGGRKPLMNSDLVSIDPESEEDNDIVSPKSDGPQLQSLENWKRKQEEERTKQEELKRRFSGNSKATVQTVNSDDEEEGLDSRVRELLEKVKREEKKLKEVKFSEDNVF